MPALPLHRLGDEPIYCEAVHGPDDDVYSGSDDDYYEGPLHRRLHIEKKAIDFLAGHVPVLLSARLRGPFDSQHWNNPWRSKRAVTQAELPSTQATRSNVPIVVERARGPDHGQVPEEDFPNTQGTSLYPLPSPEITNPPSARKNPYMIEDDYNRVKSWRQEIQGNSVPKDPFWLSQHDDSDDVSVARKRSADQDWLHRRGLKKRKFTDPRTSPPEESPSQAVAKARKNQTRRPSQLMTLSAQPYSAHEDELAIDVNTSNATVASRLAHRNTSTPRSRRVERRSPYRKQRLQGPESSEDELSLPPTTPTLKAARLYADGPKTPNGDGSPRRTTKATRSSIQSRGSGERADQCRTQVEKIQASQLSARQRLNIHAARKLSKDAARMVVKAAGIVDGNSAQGSAKNATGSATGESKTHAKMLDGISLSQQDSSFCFHKRAKSPVEKSLSPKGPMEDSTLSLSSPQLHIAAAEMEPMDHGYGAPNDEEYNDGASVASDSADIMEVDSDAKQQIPCGLMNEPEEIVDAEVADQLQPADEAMGRDKPARKGEFDKMDGLEVVVQTRTEAEPEAMADVEAVSEPNNVVTKSEAMAPDNSENTIQYDGCASFDPERPTQPNIQELLSPSPKTKAIPEDAPGIPVVEQHVDDLSDPEWSSYVDTQYLSAVYSGEGVAREDAQSIHDVIYQGPDDQTNPEWTTYVNTQDSLKEEFSSGGAGDVLVIEQGLNDPSDPEWSTFINTQDQPSVSEPIEGVSESGNVEVMDMDLSNSAKRTVIEDDDDSNSEWSTDGSATSQADADQTSDTSHEFVPAEALQDAKPSQASVGSIIDAYAEAEQPAVVVGSGGNIIIPNESHQDTIISMPGSGAVEQIEPEQEQGETVTDAICATPMEIEGAKDDPIECFVTDSGSLDETATSIEPRQTADTDNLDGKSCSLEPQQVQSQTGIDFQMPQAAESGLKTTADSDFLDQTTASLESPQLQVPWTKEGGDGLQVPQAPDIELKPNVDSDSVDAAIASTGPLEMQSPWTKETGIKDDTPLDGSLSDLESSASKAIASPQSPQTPWVANTPTHSNLPTPDFTLSIKAFSDFAMPSPEKKRASFNTSILRNRPTPLVFQKPGRRVHFAPLPGEEEAGNTEVDQKDDDTIYVEQDVSYFDGGGHKTGTVRVPTTSTRATSPPPMGVASAEVGGLPDHDSKFVRHFEAMAKRKKTPLRKSLRLLPSDSQQTATASQGAGAMAEAFIQASQTRRKALEMAEADAAGTKAGGGGGGDESSIEKGFSPISMYHMGEQENAEPVDDVSAVLDNLEEFLDNTWGVGLGEAAEGAEKAQVQSQPKIPHGKMGAEGMFDVGRDPMATLNFNVWAE